MNVNVIGGIAGSGAAAKSGGSAGLLGGTSAGTGNANGGTAIVEGGAGVGTGEIGTVLMQRSGGGVVVGLNNNPTNSSVIMDFRSTTRVPKLPLLTTTQRDALTGTEGMIIGNSTTGKVNVYVSDWEVVGSAKDELVTTTNVITAEETGKTFYLNMAGGFTSTLPAPALGLKYKFIVSTEPTTAYIITTNGGANILRGTYLDVVGELVWINNQDTLNFVASTALIGDMLEVESDGTYWFCTAFSGTDGGITVAVT